MKPVSLIGRLLFGGFFVYNGINHFRNHATLTQYARAKNVPLADAAVLASGALLLLGGGSVISGWKPNLGNAAIVAFLAGASPMMHDFWRSEDPNQRTNDMIHFMKNMALAGGALAMMESGSCESSCS